MASQTVATLLTNHFNGPVVSKKLVDIIVMKRKIKYILSNIFANAATFTGAHILCNLNKIYADSTTCSSTLTVPASTKAILQVNKEQTNSVNMM